MKAFFAKIDSTWYVHIVYESFAVLLHVIQPSFTFQPNGAGFAGVKSNVNFSSEEHLQVNFQHILVQDFFVF